MTEPRLRSELWVKAHIWKCSGAGIYAALSKTGDKTSGVILIKIMQSRDACSVLMPSLRMDGTRVWLRATGTDPVAEPVADEYIRRQVSFDSDLWVLEIEDAQGRHLLEEPIEQSDRIGKTGLPN